MAIAENPHKTSTASTAAFSLVSAAAVGMIFILAYFYPVIYTRLVTEDHWGESFTAVCLCLAGVFLLAEAVPRGLIQRRILLALAGLLCLFMAGEEISWGQRILEIPTPRFMEKVNYQAEFNIHNTEALRAVNEHLILSCLMIGYALLSMAAAVHSPRLFTWIKDKELPLLSGYLAVLFFSPPLFFLVYPLPKSDEIGELLLGLVLLLWAAERLMESRGPRPAWTPRRGVFLVAGILVTALVLTTLLVRAGSPSGNFKWRLNRMAAQDYPAFGMHAQSERIYRYIYRHPRYLGPETRLRHAEMLLETGHAERAVPILREALKEYETPGGREIPRLSDLRRIAMIHVMLGEEDKADEVFDKAAAMAREKLASAGGPDARARALWSLARILHQRGDREQARRTAMEARRAATLPSLRRNIRLWMGSVSLDGTS